jgi:hypothetical protein
LSLHSKGFKTHSFGIENIQKSTFLLGSVRGTAMAARFEQVGEGSPLTAGQTLSYQLDFQLQSIFIGDASAQRRMQRK